MNPSTTVEKDDEDDWDWSLKNIHSPDKAVSTPKPPETLSKNRENGLGAAKTVLENYAHNMRLLILTARKQINQLTLEKETLTKQLNASGVVQCPSCCFKFKEKFHNVLPKYMKVYNTRKVIEMEFKDLSCMSEWLNLNRLEVNSDGLPTLNHPEEHSETLSSVGSLIPALVENSSVIQSKCLEPINHETEIHSNVENNETDQLVAVRKEDGEDVYTAQGKEEGEKTRTEGEANCSFKSSSPVRHSSIPKSEKRKERQNSLIDQDLQQERTHRLRNNERNNLHSRESDQRENTHRKSDRRKRERASPPHRHGKSPLRERRSSINKSDRRVVRDRSSSMKRDSLPNRNRYNNRSSRQSYRDTYAHGLPSKRARTDEKHRGSRERKRETEHKRRQNEMNDDVPNKNMENGRRMEGAGEEELDVCPQFDAPQHYPESTPSVESINMDEMVLLEQVENEGDDDPPPRSESSLESGELFSDSAEMIFDDVDVEIDDNILERGTMDDDIEISSQFGEVVSSDEEAIIDDELAELDNNL